MAPKLVPEQQLAEGAPKEAVKEAGKEAQSGPPEEAGEKAPRPPAEAAPQDTAKQRTKTPKRKAPAEAAPTKEAKPLAPTKAPKQPPQAPQTERQAPQEAAEQQAKAAQDEAPKQPANGTTKQPANTGTKKAPKHSAQAPKQLAEEDWEWLQPGVFIPGWVPKSDDSSSSGHGTNLSENEITELTDVEREAYMEAPPPPKKKGVGWEVPKTCVFALIGRSCQNGAWKALCRTEYRNAAEEVAGKVTKQGQPVDFAFTTSRDRTTLAEAPKAHIYFPTTMHTTWDASEFIAATEWLKEQRPAKEAEAEAERPEKGHAAEQPQPQE